MTKPRTEVHKFGGTSVGDPGRIDGAATLIASEASAAHTVVVTSAMAGVTNDLVEAAAEAARGERDAALARVDRILDRHLETLYRLQVEDAGDVRKKIEGICRDLSELIRAVVLLGELTPRSRDRLLSCGEKLAARLLAAMLRRHGLSARALDADGFLETDGRFGEANPLVGLADRSVQAALNPVLDAGGIPVVTGFCGRAPDGATTTLGRGGSDLTATFVAAAIAADEVTIWTDVDGVFSADPRIVPTARILRHLHYREAAEMSYYGAKVLHQKSMIPVLGPGIPVRIRNSFRPDEEGSRVDSRYTPGSHPVKAISAVRGQSLLSVEGKGMSGVPGIAARVFRAMARRSISVTMISQSSSESSICLAVPESESATAEAALKQELRPELSRGDVEEVEVLGSVALIAAVGLGMAHTPGVAARVFSALSRRRVNVLAIAQGSSELNISLAVERNDVAVAVGAIHEEFGLHRLDTGEDTSSSLDLILLGYGNIGRALSELVLHRGRHIIERFGLHPRIVAICDRSGFLFRPTGIPETELATAGVAKAGGRPIAELPGAVESTVPSAMIRHALDYRLSRPVLVDVSDSDGSHEAFLEAFRLGCDVVTANKKPMAGDIADYRKLIDEARQRGRILKAEATVGAGLPVVDTLENLLATGDRVTAAAGCLSGTLAFLTSRLEDGTAFSEAVAEAVHLGYTEPDPVADLSGTDVARKAIILGRLAGLADENTTIRLTGLVSDDLAGLDLEPLLVRLRDDYDPRLADRIAEARKNGQVVRYVARVRPGEIEVGPEAVSPSSPLGGLQGTDNMIVFESERYDARPLVVSGPGAGVDVTAMGVLGDVLRVAAERR